MTHKVHPKIFRIGFTQNWNSRWFGRKKKFVGNLKEDLQIRDFVVSKFPKIALDKIEIERTATEVKVIIKTGRPGLIIGRGGEEVEKLKKGLINLLRNKNIKIEVGEVKNPETSADTMAVSVVEQIEKRMPFRRIMKQTIEKIMANREVEGVKILVKGRLNGAEIARTEWLSEGKIPLQTLRADIDYAQKNANTTYGVVSVKMWIYKGEKFE